MLYNERLQPNTILGSLKSCACGAIRNPLIKWKGPGGLKVVQGGPPWTILLNPRYFKEFLELQVHIHTADAPNVLLSPKRRAERYNTSENTVW